MKGNENDINTSGMSTGKKTPNAGPESGSSLKSGLAERYMIGENRVGDAEGPGGRPGKGPTGKIPGTGSRSPDRWG